MTDWTMHTTHAERFRTRRQIEMLHLEVQALRTLVASQQAAFHAQFADLKDLLVASRDAGVAAAVQQQSDDSTISSVTRTIAAAPH